MSDNNQTENIDQSAIIDGGGMFQGPDNRVSLRRVLGVIFAVIGILSLLASMAIVTKLIFKIIETPNIDIKLWDIVLVSLVFVPGILLMLLSFYIMKQISAQAIAGIIKKDKV